LFRQALLIDFNSFLPKSYVDFGAGIVLAIVVIGVIYGLVRWRTPVSLKTSKVAGRSLSVSAKAKVLANNLIIDVFYQKSIADCSHARWFAHLAMFWGFLGLAATTTLDEIMNPSAGPLSITSPIRILGNVSGVLFVAGVSVSLGRRMILPSVRENSTIGDGIFLGLLFLTGVSGFVTEFFSEFNFAFPDNISYWFHIILVAALLASAPFSKFVHAIGRPLLLLLRRSEMEKSKIPEESKKIVEPSKTDEA
jgi:nitrate reductase gamma subunit